MELEKYYKDLEQGGKLEILMSCDEWHFFAGWLRKTSDTIKQQILDGTYLDNIRAEDRAKGIVSALEMILKDADRFRLKAENARKKIKEIEEHDRGN